MLLLTAAALVSLVVVLRALVVFPAVDAWLSPNEGSVRSTSAR